MGPKYSGAPRYGNNLIEVKKYFNFYLYIGCQVTSIVLLIRNYTGFRKQAYLFCTKVIT